MKCRILPLLYTLPLFFIGCKKFVTVAPPTTGIGSEIVYANNGTAAAAVTSIYSRLSQSGLSTGSTGISLLAGLAADEFINYTNNLKFSQFYTNSLSSAGDVYFWPELYQQLYVANAVLEGLDRSNNLNPDIRQQLIGEAKFVRAFLHFYATNLYGDVPLVTSTDYRVNNSLSRTSATQVYAQIITDLTAARDLLSDKYLTPEGTAATNRVRPNRAAAQALLARAYLYNKQWPQAEASATAVIGNTATYTLVTDLNKVFLTTSKEAIWQLQPVAPGYNTQDGYYFVITAVPGTDRQPVSLRPSLVSLYESTDNRLSSWIGNYQPSPTGPSYYYPFKYKVNTINTTQPITESLMVLRLAEQFLIRAEARAQQNNLTGALEDLNAVRIRAGATTISGTSQPQTLVAIARERRMELFSEWGHRWLDLKRTGTIDAVMDTVTTTKGGTWKTTSQLLPIPRNEILLNPNLKQNDGY